MTQEEKAIEIPFGAEDSELIKWEYTIPEGMEAEIKDGKVIIKKAESEDERIRKALIEVFKKKLEKGFEWAEYGIPNRSVLDWLEKQKEPQYAIRATKGFGDPDGPQFELVDLQKERKPAEWEDYKDKVNIPYCSSEPEWSEEDKNKIERLAFLVSVVEEKEMISPSESIDLRNFIKSLRPQQKQEWSEEEQQTVSFAVDWLTKMLERTDVPEAKRDIESVILGLKSLRPPFKDREMKLKILKYLSARCSSLEFEEVEDYLNNLRPHWKPSEEQMKAIKHAYNSFPNDCPTKSNLRLLYQDLKKLL